jgi:hypothetical protein
MWELPTIVRNNPFICPNHTSSPRPFECWMCLTLSMETDTNCSSWEMSDWIWVYFYLKDYKSLPKIFNSRSISR